MPWTKFKSKNDRSISKVKTIFKTNSQSFLDGTFEMKEAFFLIAVKQTFLKSLCASWCQIQIPRMIQYSVLQKKWYKTFIKKSLKLTCIIFMIVLVGQAEIAGFSEKLNNFSRSFSSQFLPKFLKELQHRHYIQNWWLQYQYQTLFSVPDCQWREFQSSSKSCSIEIKCKIYDSHTNDEIQPWFWLPILKSGFSCILPLINFLRNFKVSFH